MRVSFVIIINFLEITKR